MRTGFRSLLALGLLGLLGCSSSGPELAEVSGTVTLDDQLVEEGSIQFIPVEGTTGPAAGETIKNGRYRIARSKGAVVGKNRVEVRAFRYSGRKVPDPTGPPGALTEERIQAFPPEYNDNPTVIKEIHAGSNTVDIDAKSRAGGK
jgi:hypothetical protein